MAEHPDRSVLFAYFSVIITYIGLLLIYTLVDMKRASKVQP